MRMGRSMENRAYSNQVTNPNHIVSLIGNSKEIRWVREQMAKVEDEFHEWLRIRNTTSQRKSRKAPLRQFSILLIGESGVGKEVVARLLHRSLKIPGEFVAVNSSELESNLWKNELYGHKKGSYTGASSDETGYFHQARNGTLFFDEIGDLPYDMQSKLLRVLENRAFYRVGSNREEQSELLLLITATNKDLRQRMKEEKFREDLYSRIRVHQFKIPPLRERIDDLDVLIEHFCRQYDRGPLKFSDAAKTLLQSYPWPGNVRELRTVVELCCTNHRSSQPIGIADLCQWYDEFVEYIKPPSCKRAGRNNHRFCWELDPVSDPQALIDQALDCSECEHAQNHYRETLRKHPQSSYETFILRTFQALVEKLKNANGLYDIDSDKVTLQELKNQMSKLAEKKWLEDFIKKHGMNRELLMEKLDCKERNIRRLLKDHGMKSDE